MDCRNFLITKNDVIKYCGLTANANDDTVNVCIQQAHNRLKSIICEAMLDDLISEFLADTYTGLNNTFIQDYVQPFLTWLAYSKYVVWGAQDNTKAGFRELTDDHSTPVSDLRLKNMLTVAENEAEINRKLMIRFLFDNIASFPLFEASDCYDCCNEKKYFHKISGAGYYHEDYE